MMKNFLVGGEALFHVLIPIYVETVQWYSTKILRRQLFFRPLNHSPVRKASGGQFYCTRVLQWARSGMPPLLQTPPTTTTTTNWLSLVRLWKGSI